MNTKEIGGKYRFTYPDYGTPNNYPDYTEHSGQVVTVLRKLPKQDEGVLPMYEVEARDGWIGNVFGCELRKVHSKDRS